LLGENRPFAGPFFFSHKTKSGSISLLAYRGTHSLRLLLDVSRDLEKEPPFSA
jgi:hypothetical protein